MTVINLNDPPLPTAGDGPRLPIDVKVMGAHIPHTKIETPTPLAKNIHKLTPTEAATIRIKPVPMSEVVIGCGALTEAMLWVAIMGEKGTLPWASFRHVAWHVHYTVYSIHPVALRRSRRGAELLASLAELNLVEMSINAAPTPDDPTHFRPMQLATRLRELDG